MGQRDADTFAQEILIAYRTWSKFGSGSSDLWWALFERAVALARDLDPETLAMVMIRLAGTAVTAQDDLRRST